MSTILRRAKEAMTARSTLKNDKNRAKQSARSADPVSSKSVAFRRTAVEVRAALRAEEQEAMEQARSNQNYRAEYDDFGRVKVQSRSEAWAAQSEKSLHDARKRERAQRRRDRERRKVRMQEEVASQIEISKGPDDIPRKERVRAWDGSRSDAGRMHRCPECHFMGTRRRVRAHVRTKHNREIAALPNFSAEVPILDPSGRPEPHRCILCTRIFSSARHLEVHIETAHPQERERQIFSCSLCDYSTSLADQLLLHQLKKHYRPLSYECRTCRRRFHTKRELRIHVSSHGMGSGDEIDENQSAAPKEATVTNETGPNVGTGRDQGEGKGQASSHVEVPLPSTGPARPINPEKPYRCPKCDRDFRTVRLLEVHQRRVHLKRRVKKSGLTADISSQEVRQRSAIEQTLERKKQSEKASRQNLPAQNEEASIAPSPLTIAGLPTAISSQMRKQDAEAMEGTSEERKSIGMTLLDKAIESTSTAMKEADAARMDRKRKEMKLQLRKRFLEILQEEDGSQRITSDGSPLKDPSISREGGSGPAGPKFSCDICGRKFTSEHHRNLHHKNAHKAEQRLQKLRRGSATHCGMEKSNDGTKVKGYHGAKQATTEHSLIENVESSCPVASSKDSSATMTTQPNLRIQNRRSNISEEIEEVSEAGNVAAKAVAIADRLTRKIDAGEHSSAALAKDSDHGARKIFSGVSSDPDKPHMCRQCGRCFKLRRHLDLHRKTHSRNLDYGPDAAWTKMKGKGKRVNSSGSKMRTESNIPTVGNVSQPDKFDVLSVMQSMSKGVPEGKELENLEAAMRSHLARMGGGTALQQMQGNLGIGAGAMSGIGTMALEIPQLRTVDDVKKFRDMMQKQNASIAPAFNLHGLGSSQFQTLAEVRRPDVMQEVKNVPSSALKAAARPLGPASRAAASQSRSLINNEVQSKADAYHGHKFRCGICGRGFNSQRLWTLHERSHRKTGQ